MNDFTTRYIEEAHAGIEDINRYIEMLQKRLILCREKFDQKSEYEQNEVEILERKTKAEISARKKELAFRVEYLEKFIPNFIAEIEDMEANFDRVLAQVSANKDRNGARDKLHAAIWPVINSSPIQKLDFYKQIKEFMPKK